MILTEIERLMKPAGSSETGFARLRHLFGNKPKAPALEPPPMSLYAEPRHVSGLDECDFYHTMELPGFGLVEGAWDLRNEIDAFLGHLDFTGKRVLEIGPASGYVTFEMERRGAEVVSLEVADDPGWDFVPQPTAVLATVYERRRAHMRRLKNSWWLAHRAFNSRARIVYGDACNIPDALGSFDIAVMANVLLHTRNPLSIVEQCARRAAALLVVERLFPELEGSPVCRLIPSAENRIWDGWWQPSSDLFGQFFGVLGFGRVERAQYECQAVRERAAVPLYTIVGHRL
jgi:SAM-dependent methyltransferase